MPVLFSGFPRLVERTSLRPGRWVLSGGPFGTTLSLLTDIGAGADALAVSLALRRLDQIEVRIQPLSALPTPLQTLEDELVFTPGDGEEPRLSAASRRPFATGSLLRLSNGDIGVGFADSGAVRVRLVSLMTGLQTSGFDLVFDRWSLHLRRGGREGLFGRFRSEPRLNLEEARG